MTETMRLDKYLSDMTDGTRKKVKELIKSGRVSVNDETAKKPEQKIELSTDVVYIDGERLCYTKFYYYMLNKPPGVITSTEEGKTETVMDVLKKGGLSCPVFSKLSPVGRLDKDTEGLLLITNDGELNHRLLSPKNHVDKVYFAKLDKPISKNDIFSFAAGLDLGDFISLPAILKKVNEAGDEVEVTISEGKFHQVKRMFEAVGKSVVYLKRIKMGGLKLDETLKSGEVRALTEEEISLLKKR